MKKEHYYELKIEWTGNTGSGTQDYRTYDRSHLVKKEGKKDISLSSDPAFRGDDTKHNPEELLLAAVSSCHMLWFLHLCATNKINVLAYEDNPTGTMIELENRSGHFTEITLHQTIKLEDISLKPRADKLHQKANELCFIANSCNFPIHHKAEYNA